MVNCFGAGLNIAFPVDDDLWLSILTEAHRVGDAGRRLFLLSGEQRGIDRKLGREGRTKPNDLRQRQSTCDALSDSSGERPLAWIIDDRLSDRDDERPRSLG